MLYPGTEAYDWAKKEGLITAKTWDDWLTPEGLHNTVVGTHDLSAKEIVDFCNYARRDYYLRPAYMVMKAKNILRHPSELKRTLKAFLTFYKHLFSKESKANTSKFKTRLAPYREVTTGIIKDKTSDSAVNKSSETKVIRKEPVA